MIKARDYLYYLVLKTYLIDRKEELILDDNYKLDISLDEDREWEKEASGMCLVSGLTFNVDISNKEEKSKISYKVKSHRSLATLLELPVDEKLEFITRRNFSIFNLDYRVKAKGHISSSALKKVILKNIREQLQKIKDIDNVEIKKIKKKIINK